MPKRKVKIWHGACGRWWIGVTELMGISPYAMHTRNSFQEVLDLAPFVWHSWCEELREGTKRSTG